MPLEIIRVFGNAVGYVMFHPVPYKFGWVKFRSVPREEVRMNTGMLFTESLNRSGFVHTSSIPQKHEPSLEMLKKVSQKGQDLRMPDVLQWMEADIQSNSPFAGGDADRGDGRYFRPSSGDFKNRSLSDRSPGLSDSRDKTKSALVEEDKRNFKPFGLFLYAAMNVASIALFPFHLALWLWSRASDGSSATLAGSSKHDRDDMSPQTDHRSLWPLFPRSTDQWSNRFSGDLPQALAQASVFGARLVSQVYPAPVLISMLYRPSVYVDRSSSTPNLTNNRVLGLSSADSFRYPRALRPAAYAFQALFGFHGVSWNQYTIFLLLMRESINMSSWRK